jgi:2'-5' RNA ligase
MLRAFLAIDLPSGLRPVLSRMQEELRKSGADVRWVPVGNIHITLKFFGHIPEAQVDPIIEAASRITQAQAPFNLKVTGAGAFPTVTSPRVVWLGVDGDLAGSSPRAIGWTSPGVWRRCRRWRARCSR